MSSKKSFVQNLRFSLSLQQRLTRSMMSSLSRRPQVKKMSLYGMSPILETHYIDHNGEQVGQKRVKSLKKIRNISRNYISN